MLNTIYNFCLKSIIFYKRTIKPYNDLITKIIMQIAYKITVNIRFNHNPLKYFKS